VGQDLGSLNAQFGASDTTASSSLPPDPIGYPGASSLYFSLENDPRNRLSTMGPSPDQPLAGAADPFAQTETANPNVIPIADNEESFEQHELKKFRDRTFGGKAEGKVSLPTTVPALPAPLPRTLPPQLPGQSAAGPRPLSPSVPGTPAPRPSSTGERPEPVEAGANVGDVGPPAPAGGRNPSAPLGRGKQYEQEQGSQQTTIHAIVDGKDVKVILDFPPSEKGTVDLKDYKWFSPGYQVPFLQQQVIEDFQAQIRKYQAIHPPVRFRFSQQPPPWVEKAIEEAGGTYFVKPQ
jgi:hypothetical protein